MIESEVIFSKVQLLNTALPYLYTVSGASPESKFLNTQLSKVALNVKA